MAGKLQVTWVKSAGRKSFIPTLRGLGLRKLNHTVLRSDTPEIRGMIKKVIHLLEVKEIKE